MIKWILGGLAAREGIQQLVELQERRQVFQQARDYADSVRKPLLVVGTPKWGVNHPCGDVTIDLNEGWGQACPVELADVRAIPYPDSCFGAAYCSHVLEHLLTIDDAIKALDEMERVADKVFVVSPHKTSLAAWLYGGHHLWLTPSGDGYIIEQRGNGGKVKPESYVIAMEVV
jgi:hypothetical protein